MRAWLRIPLQLAALGLLAAVVVTAVVTGAYFYVEPTLARAEELRDFGFQTPLRIYSVDGRYMQQYGEEKRIPADLADIPERLRNAVIAAEDDRFYQHNGIDLLSTLRAVINYSVAFVTRSGDRPPGGSTITQQVTRTTELLPRDYAIGRKIVEIFLALEIEKRFTKDEILELYLNTYFFGQRSYGVVTAAQTYFDRELDQLSLSEAAIIAGIPTAPSRNNPYTSPENAERRRAYVLRRMHELGFISQSQREAALAEPVVSALYDVTVELEGSYVAAMAYRECQRRLGKDICDEAGLKITTTVDSRLQRAANRELREVLQAYDRDHGYRGPLGRIDLASLGLGAGEASGGDSNADGLAGATSPAEALRTLLADYPARYGAEAAVVLDVGDVFAEVFLRDTGRVTIGFDAVDWARPWINDDRQGVYPDVVGDVLAAGDIVRFRRLEDGRFELAQVPEAGRADYVQGAFVSVDPRSGAIVALAGGYDFGHSNYNRATQADERQPGSAFKPFFYLSALDAGYTLSSIVNDAAICFYDETLEREHCPQNYGGSFHGEIRLREVLINSLNASAYRVIRDIGASHAARYVERFGFRPEPRERNSSIALGSLGVSPLELANGYAILANGGYAVGIADPDTGSVGPYFLQRIEDARGRVLYDADRSVRTVCPEPSAGTAAAGTGGTLVERVGQLYPRFRCAERVDSAQRIYLITSVLKDVVLRGSGQRAYRAIPRSDIAGKTGTTNGPKDVWFAGFTPDIAAVVRVGFDDDERDLGNGEQGGVTAIPAWIGFMETALAGMPERSLPRPPGIIERRIDPATGLIAADCRPNDETIREIYLIENQPRKESDDGCFSRGPTTSSDPESSGSAGSGFLFD